MRKLLTLFLVLIASVTFGQSFKKLYLQKLTADTLKFTDGTYRTGFQDSIYINDKFYHIPTDSFVIDTTTFLRFSDTSALIATHNYGAINYLQVGDTATFVALKSEITTDHNNLTNRDATNAHPSYAIGTDTASAFNKNFINQQVINKYTDTLLLRFDTLNKVFESPANFMYMYNNVLNANAANQFSSNTFIHNDTTYNVTFQTTNMIVNDLTANGGVITTSPTATITPDTAQATGIYVAPYYYTTTAITNAIYRWNPTYWSATPTKFRTIDTATTFGQIVNADDSLLILASYSTNRRITKYNIALDKFTTTSVVGTSGQIYGLNYYNGWIYFTTSATGYTSMRIHKDSLETNSFQNIYVLNATINANGIDLNRDGGDTILLNTRYGILSCKTDGTIHKFQPLGDCGSTTGLSISNGQLYYLGNNQFACYRRGSRAASNTSNFLYIVNGLGYPLKTFDLGTNVPEYMTINRTLRTITVSTVNLTGTLLDAVLIYKY